MNKNIGDVATIENAAITNNVGGTEILYGTIMQAKIVDVWYDYEVGERFIGELFLKGDIDVATQKGTTGHTPEDYKKYGEEMYQRVKKCYENFNPKKVYFSEHRIIR